MISIRPETSEDIPAIRDVIQSAFGRAAEADLVDALRRNGRAILSLVAEDHGRIIGHIMFSPVAIETAEGELNGVGLAPLAVRPERQNEGVGSQLVHGGLAGCRAADFPFVIVLGHPEYYPRFGFVPASRFKIKGEYDVADEVFMALELRIHALQKITGIARYGPEFREF